MQDYRKALADIEDIRARVAAGTTFNGLGPAALAATAGLAMLAATFQSARPPAGPWSFFGLWIAVAVLAVLVMGIEMVRRSKVHHQGLADAMIWNAVAQFLPAGAAGAGLLAAFARFAPESLWMLPGLWQVLVSLGLFAAVRSLPPGAALAGAWYFVAGFAVLGSASVERGLSPWSMGLPFVAGQLILAFVLHRAGNGGDAS